MLFLSLAGARFGDFGGVAWVMTRFVLQRGPTRVSHKSLSQVTRVSQKRIFQKCVTGVSEGCFTECLRSVFARDAHKSASEGCLKRVSQECLSLMCFEEVAFPSNSPGQSFALLGNLRNFKKHPQKR